MSNQPQSDRDLPQIALNKTAEAAIASQLESGEIDVSLDSDLSHLVGGEVDRVEVAGEKIILVKDIQLEQLNISGKDLSLDLTQVLLGKIAFDRPGKFQVKLVFSESDCDRLLNSKYVRVLLQSLSLDLNRPLAKFFLQQSQCSLQDGQISLLSTVVLEGEETHSSRFEISFRLREGGSKIQFIGGKYLEERSIDFAETIAILNKVRDMLYLRHFQNADLSFELTRIEVCQRQLIIFANASIAKLPDSISQSVKSVASEIDRQ